MPANKNNETWKKICEVFLFTKKLTIQLEETSCDHKTFIQPINELKSALDHIVRIKAVEVGLNKKDKSSQYIESNLNKTLGHIYRAFFDTADYYSMVLREKIINLLKKYSSNTIHKVIQDYYSDKRIYLEKINKEIADIRGKKDIGNESNILPSIDIYFSKIEKIDTIYQDILSKIPQLDDLHKIENKKKKRKFILSIMGIVFGIIGIIGTTFTILSFILK
jgi:hypothetical protein